MYKRQEYQHARNARGKIPDRVMAYLDSVAFELLDGDPDLLTLAKLRRVLRLDIGYPNDLEPLFKMHQLVTRQGQSEASASKAVAGDAAADALRHRYRSTIKKARAESPSSADENQNWFEGAFLCSDYWRK